MTYDAREKSTFEGQPVECFRFTQGSTTWWYTSADEEIVLPAGTFTPAVIERGETDYSQEDSAENVEVAVDRTNPVAALFIGDAPSTAVWLTIFRAHRDELSLGITAFSGRVMRARFEESRAILVCASLTGLLGRAVPPLVVQTQCNHALYSTGCGVSSEGFARSCVVGEVDGRYVVSDDFYDPEDPELWFEGGYLEGGTGERRFIVRHVEDEIELISPLPGLIAGHTVIAYAGCDRLEATCREKFDNLENHLGWSNLPNRNPFNGRVD